MIQSNDSHRTRLLILDEDRIMLQSLAAFLRREGYDVRTTDNVADAMHELERSAVDVLIADVNQPGVKAGDLLRDLRRRYPQTVVVVVTSYGTVESAVELTSGSVCP